MKNILVVGFILITLTLIGFMAIYNVPTKITHNDAVFIQKILNEANADTNSLQYSGDFDEQIALIKTVQQSAFQTAPINRSIAQDNPREPENLYYSSHAYCFDRARYIDKALRFLGFQARYAGIFEDEANYNVLETITTPSSKTRVQSHAVVEVLTAKGWMIVDTRTLWISLTKNNEPVSLKSLQNKSYDAFTWSTTIKDEPWPLLKEKFHVFYGLYSRHGRFYPPYTQYIPDINWQAFIGQNLQHLWSL